MDTAYFILATFLVLATLLPLTAFQHWAVRGFDFGKIQLTILESLTILGGFLWVERSAEFWITQVVLLASQTFNLSILLKYSRFYPIKPRDRQGRSSRAITLLSANVLQFNTDYPRFLRQVQEHSPDLVLTMESNEDWDTAMRVLEAEYPHFCKVPLENTYGMHLYSKIPMTFQVHYFVADDLPSIEAEVKTEDGYRFTLFCVHPPPPSPTEEETSKERDGELLSVAQKVRADGRTSIIVGDFNNVAWSRSSVLFRRASETIDPRVGRGFIATFHARYWFLRFPIDQLFHTPDVFIEELKTLPYFGSDHFALSCRFTIDHLDDTQEELVEELEEGDEEVIEEMIEEGIEEESDREEIATE
ncbi:MAG: endonuclease/exonuclease/phosphatase family protein [Vulcanimicrobiota bacterium]